MIDLVQSPHQAISHEMITRLINAGYLLPALRNDADAIARAIAKMKEDLRGCGSDDDGAQAAVVDGDGPRAA
jgi:hypothetical protein